MRVSSKSVQLDFWGLLKSCSEQVWTQSIPSSELHWWSLGTWKPPIKQGCSQHPRYKGENWQNIEVKDCKKCQLATLLAMIYLWVGATLSNVQQISVKVGSIRGSDASWNMTIMTYLGFFLVINSGPGWKNAANKRSIEKPKNAVVSDLLVLRS